MQYKIRNLTSFMKVLGATGDFNVWYFLVRIHLIHIITQMDAVIIKIRKQLKFVKQR